tara:strand:- start:2 stop:217 length:216 start_codon:yes stop_codon:yes gene_type:complete
MHEAMHMAFVVDTRNAKVAAYVVARNNLDLKDDVSSQLLQTLSMPHGTRILSFAHSIPFGVVDGEGFDGRW